MAAKTLKEIEKIVDDYEKALRKLDKVVTYNNRSGETDLNLIKNKGLVEFLKDFLYYNHLLCYDDSNSNSIFSHTRQIERPGEKLAEICIRQARRSIGDLFRLALKYYSDRTTLYDTMEAMYTIVQAGERIKCKSGSYSGVVYMNICHTIHRRVFNLDIGSSERLSYRFDSKNNDFTSTSYLDEEFNILGTDYDLLFNTIAGKSFLKGKRETGFTLQVSPQEELDRAVMEKLAKMTGKRESELILQGKYNERKLSAYYLNDDYDAD